MTFTKSDIKERIADVLDEDFPLKLPIHYGQDDFTNSSSEESLYVISGKMGDFREVIKFWIKGFERIIEFESRFDGDLDYFEWYEADAFEVDKLKFQKEFGSMTSRLEKEVTLDSNAIKFYHVRNEWNEQAFILEYDDELKMIYWSTTA